MAGCVGLLRVSTDEQGRSGLGVEAQCSAIEEFCARTGQELVAVFREVVSGSTPLDARFGLLSALDHAEAFGASLVVARRDRLSRDPMVCMLVERRVQVLSADGTSGGDDPGAVFTRRVLDAVAELERNLIAARTKAALEAKKRRGEPMGRAPYGFRWINGELQEHPEQMRVLCRILEAHSEGMGVRAIAKFLNGTKHRSQSGGQWHPTQINRVLKRAKQHERQRQ